MSIYLIRHGQTDGNRNRIVQTPDTPLSELGHQQAQQLARAFKHVSIGNIICSDLTRTQQTAAPLRKLLNCSFSLEPLLRERSFGDLRGQAYDQIDADFFAEEYSPQNGETHPEFAERVNLAWDSILTAYQKTSGSIIVMTHGLVLRELVNRHLTVKDGVLPLSEFQNTSITEVCASDQTTIVRLCDAEHLHSATKLGSAV